MRVPAVLMAVWGGLLLAAPVAGQDPFAAQVRPTDPLAPAEQQKTFRLPAGFEIRLFAAEPDILKPMNMAFDERGRLWITESTEYPYAAPSGRQGRDSIKVLEDTTGDGRADSITTFADGLNIPMGLYPYRDGVIAFSIPHVWHLRDTTGDGRCDTREKLYGPMGWERDTHGLNNAFRRGFDGWLYACHGFNNETTVRGTDGHTVRMQSGNTYRMRTDGSRVEQFTWGQVNPFGMAMDELGNLFTSDCHSKPIYQLLRGGHYPSFGKPHDGLGFAPPMMEHLHGSTAIAGLAYYTGENFPPEYRDNMFSGNVMTSRINRNSLEHRGSTIIAHEEPDFVISSDPWFRPVDLQVGPDGALYVADFYNRIIGHYEVPLDHPGRDRHRGRIWRIVYTESNKKRPVRRPPDLTTISIDNLIGALDHAPLEYRMLAMHRLVDEFGEKAVEPVRRAFRTYDQAVMRSHALWVLHRLDALQDSDLKLAAGDEHRIPRVHAMRVLSERTDWNAEHRTLALAGLRDADAFVQRAAADALGRHPQYENIDPLLELLRAVPEADTHLRHTVRMALRNQLVPSEHFTRLMQVELNESRSRTIAAIAPAVPTPAAGTFLVRHIQQYDEPRERLVTFLEHAARHVPQDGSEPLVRLIRERFAADIDFQLGLLTAIETGLKQRGMPAGASLTDWADELARTLLDSIDAGSRGWVNTPLDGKASRDNPWTLQPRPSADGDGQSLFLSSLPRGERLTGVLRSPTFEVPPKLSFYIAGHLGPPPQQPDVPKNLVRLRDAETQTVLKEALPPRHDTARPVEWDLQEHAGRRAWLEIIDGDDGGGWAWLAVGRFSPAAVTLPTLAPAQVAERQRSAAVLAGRFQLKGLKPALCDLLLNGTADLPAREATAAALVALEPDGRLSALTPLVGDPAVPAALRDRIARVFVDREPETVRTLLAEAVRTAPQRLQTVLADTLAADRSGAETLLQLVTDGHASPRLLLNPSIQAKLQTVGTSELAERAKRLTARLPSEDETIRRLIAERLDAFSRTETSLQRGAAHFTKHCAACHQIDGKGTVVGPQLDGIGNRGLERLIEDVLDPNRNVDVAFRTTTLVLTNGQVVTGLVRREEGAVLILVDGKGQEFTVPKADIEEQAKSNLSLMPANVAELLTEQEFHDLLAYLLSKRVGPPASHPEMP